MSVCVDVCVDVCVCVCEYYSCFFIVVQSQIKINPDSTDEIIYSRGKK